MTDFSRRTALRALTATAAGALAAPSRLFAAEPVPLVRLLFGFPPGGVGEVVTRGVADKLTGDYAKAVIVDNRPGAAGRLAIDVLKGSPADGSVLLAAPSSTLAMYPHVYAKLSYDPLVDLAPVSNVCEFVHALAIGPAVPTSVKTVADFVAWCRANPAQASVANPGEGSLPHFLTLLVANAAATRLQAVPYRGSTPAVNDLMGGQVPAMMASEGSFAAYVRDGRVRLLATSGAQRSRFSPTVGTFAEQGLKNLVVSEWIGLFAPAKTPAATIERASATLRTGLAQADIADKATIFAVVPAPSTPGELAARLKADLDYWGPVVKATGFTPLS